MSKKTTQFLLTLLILLSTASVALAQGVVRGVVVDAGNGEPLIGATVRIDGTTVGTQTSLDGSFSIRVPSGKQRITIK